MLPVEEPAAHRSKTKEDWWSQGAGNQDPVQGRRDQEIKLPFSCVSVVASAIIQINQQNEPYLPSTKNEFK